MIKIVLGVFVAVYIIVLVISYVAVVDSVDPTQSKNVFGSNINI